MSETENDTAAKAPNQFNDYLETRLAAFRADPGLCPGYSGRKCGKPATYFQSLMNDPRAYCKKHALQASAWWNSLGFPGPSYVRLSDGNVFVAGDANK